jgi:tetratricopeptide (TPR) repeat protein
MDQPHNPKDFPQGRHKGHEGRVIKSLVRRRNWWSGVKNLIFGLIIILILNILPFNQVEAIPFATYLIQQGKELFQASRFTEAVTIWQQALNEEKAQGNQLTQAMLLNHLSLAYQQLGQLQQAEAAISSSLKLIQSSRNSNNHVSRKLIFAQALNTQGSLQLAQGKTEQALHTWQQATGAYTEAGSVSGKIGANLNQAQAQQALGMYLQARKTLKELEQTLLNQPDQELKITGLRSLGNVLRLVGDLNDSRRVLQQITTIQSENIPNTTFKQHLSLTFLSLGNTARAQGDTEAALTYYQQAIATSSRGIKQLQAEINKLSLLIETKQQADAEILSQQISSKLTDLPTSRVAVYAAINFSQSLMKLGDGNKKSSAQILAKAIQQAKNLGDQRAESYALGYLGGLYEKNQQWSQAQDLTQQALQIAQAINASDIVYQWQWQLGRILRARGEVEQATGAYQVAFTTLKSLRSDLVAINPDIQFSFRESVEPLYREYVETLLSEGNSGEIEPSQENLKQARVVIESLQLAELDNFFRSACLQGQIVPVEQIEQSQAAVIYPIILKDKLEVIVSLQGRLLSHYSTKVSQSQV